MLRRALAASDARVLPHSPAAPLRAPLAPARAAAAPPTPPPSPPARLIAFHLPQFHPIPENDRWWGPGFTEWTNVVKARPRFRGHYQPHLPADLGFYDLRVPEARHAQAELARRYGISAFCYYHYWFEGRRLLERPVDEILRSGEPDFPFLLCWANHHWTRTWGIADDDVLMAQTYSPQDDLDHIRWLAQAFADPRYLRVDGKPLLLVFRALELPDPERTAETWREECQRLGIGEILLCQVQNWHEIRDPGDIGFDAALEFQPFYGNRSALRRLHRWRGRADRLLGRVERAPRVHAYEDFVQTSLARPASGYPLFPCAAPGWDNSPRLGRSPIIFHGSTPEKYGRQLAGCIRAARATGGPEPLVFINAWNEWAEGAHLEPCQRWGHGYLEATRSALQRASATSSRYRDS